MSAIARSPAEEDLTVPVAVIALLLGCSIAFLVVAGLAWTDSAHEPDAACAEAVARAGIAHAYGALVRLSQTEAWIGQPRGGGIIAELGEETALDAISGFPAVKGRMAYRVRVADNADGTVRITSVGCIYPETGSGLERGAVMRVLQTSFRPFEPSEVAGR
jgi:hypothetical protein